MKYAQKYKNHVDVSLRDHNYYSLDLVNYIIYDIIEFKEKIKM